MFESIGKAVLAHKKILITALAGAVIAGYVLPTPLNTAAAPNLPNVSVNTPKSYLHVFDQTLQVNTPGSNLELHFAGIT